MSFKKTLAAVAVLGAFAGTAMAANVTLYGVVDEGLNYTYKDVKDLTGAKVVDGKSTLSLDSGIDAGSRWGIRGVEELNPDWKVAFKLESGFNVDDGTEQQDRLFRREASLSIISDKWGTLSAGRMGGISSSAGTYDIVMLYGDPFDGGAGDVWGLIHSSRYDNMLTYQTPRFYGLQATVQYSFKTDSPKTKTDSPKTKTDSLAEGTSHADRYASFALTGDYGAFDFVFGYEFQDWSTKTSDNRDDGHAFFLGGNYDCGFAKTFLMGQYFTGQKPDAFFNDIPDDNDDKYYKGLFDKSTGLQGWGVTLGTQIPVYTGKLTLAGYYVDASAEDTVKDTLTFDRDASYLGFAARYEYPLSKRTQIYTGAGWYQAKADSHSAISDETDDYKEQEAQFYVGMTHRF
jgi:predicted porin